VWEMARVCLDTKRKCQEANVIVGGVTTTVVYTGVWRFRGLMVGGKYGAVIGRKTHFLVCAQYELPGYGFLFSQSQRRISPISSHHGISPNDSVNYSG
jgi:hypothetical protein